MAAIACAEFCWASFAALLPCCSEGDTGPWRDSSWSAGDFRPAVVSRVADVSSSWIERRCGTALRGALSMASVADEASLRSTAFTKGAADILRARLTNSSLSCTAARPGTRSKNINWYAPSRSAVSTSISSLSIAFAEKRLICPSSRERQRKAPITSSVARPWSAGDIFTYWLECKRSDAYASWCSMRSKISNAATRAGEMDMSRTKRRDILNNSKAHWPRRSPTRGR